MNKELGTISQAYFNNQLIIRLQTNQLYTDILDKAYGILSNNFVKATYPFYLSVKIEPAKNSDFNFSSQNYTTFSLLNIIAIFFPDIASKYQYDYFSNNNYNNDYSYIVHELKEQESDFFNFYCDEYNYKIMLKPFALKQFNLYTMVANFYNDYGYNNIDTYYLLTNSIQENDNLAEAFAKYKLLELDQKWNDKNE